MSRAEQGLVGVLLLNSKLLDSTIVQPEHMTKSMDMEILKAMREIEREGGEVDVLSILMRNPNVSSEYIAKLKRTEPSTHNLQMYEKAILRDFQRREGLRYASELSDEIQGSEDFSGAYQIIDKLEELNSIGKVVRYDPQQAAANFFEHILYGVKMGVSTGFTELDRMINGLRRKKLIVIGARPAMGKSALVVNIFSAIRKQDKVPMLFTMEMGVNENLGRMFQAEYNLTSEAVKAISETMNDVHVAYMNEFMDSVAKDNNMFIDDTAGVKVSYIREEVKKKKKELKKRGEEGKEIVVMIDYLQLMSPERPNANRVQEIGEISRGLKRLAMEQDICVIALSQLSRGVEQRQDKRPMMSDLRESGEIEQDADVIGFIYRDDYYNPESSNPNITEIIIAKCRDGKVGTAQLAFVKEYSKFCNLERSFS
jgi:replicative DNA helicase